MTEELIQKIKALAEDQLNDTNIFVVSVKMLPSNELCIVLDGDEGVKVEDCMKVSRAVGHHIEEENWIDHAYRLEVTSFGVGNSLELHRQYVKNIGRRIEVKTKETTYEGLLQEVSEAGATLTFTKKEKGKKAETLVQEIPFNEIVTAKILVTF